MLEEHNWEFPLDSNNSVKKYEKIRHFLKSDFIENILNTIIHEKKGKAVKIKLEESIKIELEKVQIEKLEI